MPRDTVISIRGALAAATANADRSRVNFRDETAALEGAPDLELLPRDLEAALRYLDRR